MKPYVFALLISSVICFGANRQPKISKLDATLKQILQNTSNTGKIDFFKLPTSNDWDKIPQDILNPITKEKVELGKFLFHETGLAKDPNNKKSINSYSCASCHIASAGFQANVVQGIGEGGSGFGQKGEKRIIDGEYDFEDIDVQPIRTSSILNSAYQNVTTWNGKFGANGLNKYTRKKWIKGSPEAFNLLGFEGVETQAIAAMKVHRSDANSQLFKATAYKQLFKAAYPKLSTNSIKNKHVGLTIAAYERTVVSNEAPFQKWLGGDFNAMTEQEKQGAILFFTKAKCVNCHTGPALNSTAFYALGMYDLGHKNRDVLIKDLKKAKKMNLGRGGFTELKSDYYKFKVPQLYNLSDSPFYGHGASFNSIKEIVNYKNNGIKENIFVPDNQINVQFKPLGLSDVEIDQLVQFLEKSLYDPNLQRYVPKALPSGNCFPNGDRISVEDLGCF